MEAEAKAKVEAEARAKVEAEAEIKARVEKTRADAEAKSKAEAEAKAKADAEAQVAAAKSDRGRIKSILECEEAKGRGALANHLALETDMTLDGAKALLAKSPKESRLDDAMRNFGPGVRSQEVTDTQQLPLDTAEQIYARRAKVFNEASRRSSR